DSSLDLDVLGPGEEWSWDMDLASLHYPIPPGAFRIDAVYQYPPESVSLSTPSELLEVIKDPVVRVMYSRDNPILDRLTFLIEAETKDGPAFFLRFYNYDLPLASWYSPRVLEADYAEAPFLASAGFYQTEDIDLCYRHWLVWRRRE